MRQTVKAEFFLKMPSHIQEELVLSFHKYTHSDWPDDQPILFSLVHKPFTLSDKKDYQASVGELRRFYTQRLILEIAHETL